MARRTRIYFVTDLHGSSKCFRKFINAAPIYKADVLILGGDLAGKALQTIVRQPGGRWACRFIGTDHLVEDGAELEALERLIEDHGYYPYRAEPGELDALRADGSLDALFVRLMHERLRSWLDLADARLRPTGTPLYFMLGNDDPIELRELLDSAPWGTHAEGKVVAIDDDHEMGSWGYANITPWNSHREQTEEQLAESLAEMAAGLHDPGRAVVNVHVPPVGTGLDEAPVLDEDLRVVQVLGQVKFAGVGSSAVREFLETRQPMLGLHGHIHESSGIRRLGRTIAINPGSDYSTGALNGALITLERDKVAAHQLVRG
ncbi:MAG TPA: metallophosphoesterase [Candidatus Dormibacteraeota bacterium]|nr:metallophosphoesterase [Candidatus Dormibacteraeota bacterium]